MLRRDYLVRTGSCALAAAMIRPSHSLASCAAKTKNGLGLQLWTVRNQMEADTPTTLKAIAAAGYKQIELGRVVGSEDIVKRAKDLNLEVRSSFFNWQTIAEPSSNVPSVDEVIEKAKEFGLEYLVFGYIGKSARDTADKLKAIADRANEAAEKIVAAGMQMSYHNHSFEFEKMDGDKTGFDLFVERFDEKLVNFELDVFWAAIGGLDPVETLKKLGTRVGQVHLKDLKKGVGVIYDEGKVPHEAFEEVGDGSLDMKAIMEVATKNGVTQFHVEQDQSPDPITSIGQSAKYTAKNLW